MKRTLRTLLVWLLVALLPLHAVAASLGMSCAAAQRQSPAVAAALHEPLAGAHAHHDGKHAAQARDAHAGAHSPAPQIEQPSHASCSACSALCTGAVAPPSCHLRVPAFDGTDAVAVAPAVLAVGFIQDGPQRPPRQ